MKDGGEKRYVFDVFCESGLFLQGQSFEMVSSRESNYQVPGLLYYTT